MPAGLSITVDVDGVAGLGDGGAGYDDRLTSRSERLYGIHRGLPRVLGVLADRGVHGTFYVPGVTALAHPDEIGAIAAAGHELAHHGHTHRRPDGLGEAAQHAELVDGLAALATVTTEPVVGYRAPAWELTPVTLTWLGALGFAYDSSLMGEDAPYPVQAGSRTIRELPVHWSLDDAPHFRHSTDPAGLLSVWLDELVGAQREARHLTLTLHPDILGRPHRIDVLHRVLEHAAATPVVRHRDVP